jgi:hypothetical protein
LAGRALAPAALLAQDEIPDFDTGDLDSATVDSLTRAYADSVARADSLAALGITEFAAQEGFANVGPELLGREPPAHPVDYNTGYSVLRNRTTWDQRFDFYVRVGRAALANRTSMTIIDDPDVFRHARIGDTAFELGLPLARGFTTGVRLALGRDEDLIGIRLDSSILRETDQASLFARWDRVWGRFPYAFDLSLGAVREQQPEYSRRGLDGRLDFSTSGPLVPGVQLSTGATLLGSQLRSESPEPDGTTSEGEDRSFDRSARLALAWRADEALDLGLRGTVRRGQVQRPEDLFDQTTSTITVVQENVTQVANTAGATVNYKRGALGKYSASATLGKTDFLYTVDQTRTTISDNFALDLRGEDRLFGAASSGAFRSNYTTSDYTRRPDGYLQDQWNRVAELRLSGPLNRRATLSGRGSISLTSRRYNDFQPSSDTSFPPSDQDLFRVLGALLCDYRPWSQFSTSLEGRIDYNQTINLASTSSINNTDQTGYNVVWSWTYSPFGFWSVTQSNSAGANEIFYPFASTRDQLAFIYQLRTASTVRLAKTITLELNYNLRYQSRGTFRESGDGERLYGKTGGSDQYDLLLRALYRPASWFQFEISDQYFLTQNFSESGGTSRVDTETRRTTLLARANASYDFGKRASLTASLRRTLTHDETETYTVVGRPPVVRDDDLWQSSLGFRVYFDLL